MKILTVFPFSWTTKLLLVLKPRGHGREKPISVELWPWMAGTWTAVVPPGVAHLLLLNPVTLSGI